MPPIPGSTILLTSHSPEIFDEYTRRQYMAKAPQRNPFGVEDVPVSFSEFYIFTQVVFALSQIWTFVLTLLRFAYYNSLHNGPWEILIVFARRWLTI